MIAAVTSACCAVERLETRTPVRPVPVGNFALAADAERMVAACRDAKVRLMIAYRMQYEATQRAAIAAVRNKEIGDLRMIEAVNGEGAIIATASGTKLRLA